MEFDPLPAPVLPARNSLERKKIGEQLAIVRAFVHTTVLAPGDTDYFNAAQQLDPTGVLLRSLKDGALPATRFKNQRTTTAK